VSGTYDFDLLEIAIRAGVEVRPGDVGRVRIVDLAFLGIRVLLFRVEVVRLADTAQRADRRTEIHVIARYEQAPAAFAKPRDRVAIRLGQAVAHVDREEPELIEVALVDRRQDRIRPSSLVAVAHCDMVERRTSLIALFPEERHEPAEPSDRPVVLSGRDRCLQQDFFWLDGHVISFAAASRDLR
jgi:hypothetical protein